MTQVEWEKIFLENLTTIPDAERFKMAEYYREIYGDKLEAGQTPDEILAEFGDPKECAIRILKENESELETPQGIQEETKQEPKQEKQPLIMKDEVEEPDEEKDGYWTPSVLVGMALLTVLLIERTNASALTNSVYTICAPKRLHSILKPMSVTSSIGARKRGRVGNVVFPIFMILI